MNRSLPTLLLILFSCTCGRAQSFTFLVLLTCTLVSCNERKSDLLTGKWQSLNDRHLSFEFNKSNEKRLIRLNIQGDPGFKDTMLVMDSKFRVLDQSGNRLKIIENAGYGDDASIVSEIEFLNDDRIIIYIYKHHGILDLADEFARTSSPHKFDSIMNAIMATPDNSQY